MGGEEELHIDGGRASPRRHAVQGFAGALLPRVRGCSRCPSSRHRPSPRARPCSEVARELVRDWSTSAAKEEGGARRRSPRIARRENLEAATRALLFLVYAGAPVLLLWSPPPLFSRMTLLSGGSGAGLRLLHVVGDGGERSTPEKPSDHSSGESRGGSSEVVIRINLNLLNSSFAGGSLHKVVVEAARRRGASPSPTSRGPWRTCSMCWLGEGE